MKNTDVDVPEFISMMKLWVYKTGTYPLELITFLRAEKSGEKLIAIPDYSNPENYLFLGDASYKIYRTALARVGALMDNMDFERTMNIHKASSPLSYPAFSEGYMSQDDLNPFEAETDEHYQWAKGREFGLSELESN